MQGLNVLLYTKLFYIKLSSRVLQTPDEKINKKFSSCFVYLFVSFVDVIRQEGTDVSSCTLHFKGEDKKVLSTSIYNTT